MTTPIYFRLRKNSKRPVDCFTKVIKSKSVDMTAFNKGLRTGHVSNITAVDLDLYKGGNSTAFINAFGKNYVKKFNTLTQKTPSGGVHLLFQYEEDVRQTQTDAIDIRNDGGYVVFSPSTIDGKRYEIINDVDIKPMPPQLKDWLLDNLYTTKQPAEKTHVTSTQHHATIDDFSYLTIPDPVLQAELAKVPTVYVASYSQWFQLTCMMKSLGKRDLWEALSKRSTKFNKVDNDRIWDALKPKFTFTSSVLHACGSKLINLMKFKPYTDALPKPYKKIDCKYLSDGIQLTKHNYIIKSDTGTGKTTLFKQYCMKTSQKFICVGSRVSLIDEQCRTFTDCGLRVAHYKDAKDDSYLDASTSLATTIDSIEKFNCLEASEFVLFLDEFNSLIEYIFMTDKCLSNKRLSVLSTLVYFIKNCKQVVATDADISNVCFKLLGYCGLDYRFVHNVHKHNEGIKAVEVGSLDAIVEAVRACIKKNERYLVCSDSKTLAEYIYVQTGKKGKLYTSDNDERLSIELEPQLIVSPKVVYGNDSNIGRKVFCAYSGNTITPPNMLQQMNRERLISDVCFYFENRRYSPPMFNDRSECVDFTKEQNRQALKQFEIVSPQLNQLFVDVLQELVYRYDCYNSNKYCHFIDLMQKRGFKVLPSYSTNANPRKKEVGTAVLEWRSDNFATDKNDALSKILKLDTPEDADEFKDVFLEPHRLVHHFNVCRYLLKETDPGKMRERMEILDDFSIKKMQVDWNKMSLLKKFEKASDFDRSSFECASGLSKRQSTQYNTQFKEAFGYTRTDLDLTDTYICNQQLYKCYRQLFGDVVVSKKVKRAKKVVVKYTLQRDRLDRHKTLLEFRQLTRHERNSTIAKRYKGTARTLYHMGMYFIVYDGEENEQPDDGSNQCTVRWKDDKKQYFKNYHAREFTCTCGKVLRVGSKPNHLRSLKHKLHKLETAQVTSRQDG